MVSKSKVSCPKVSAVIVNWNGLDKTVECLDSLQKVDYPNCEVIVVDNGSTDGSQEAIRKSFPEVTLLVSEKNLGWGGGTNLGMRHALANGARYVWLLNNDLVVEEDTLSKLIYTAENAPGADLISPILYHYSARTEVQHCGSIFDWKNYVTKNFTDPDNMELTEQQDFWLWCTAILVKRYVVEKIGFFDEKFFIYYDDQDYSSRAISAGYQHKLEPTAKVYHRHHSVDCGSIRNAPLHYFYYTTRNEYWFWCKNFSAFRKALFLRTYLTRIMRKLEFYKSQGWHDIVEVCLDGLWCGVRNIEGQWDNTKKMPKLLKRIIMSRPYFWSHVFEGNIGKIFVTFMRKIKGQHQDEKSAEPEGR